MIEENDVIERILKGSQTIAVVGLSPRPDRPSHSVARYLQAQGYRIIPVNPMVEEVLGQRSYPDLASIPGEVDVVDIFRRPEHVPPIVEQAIQIGARAVWMQEGVINQEAAERAREAGLDVVMDRCMFKEHSRLVREGKLKVPSEE
ncbi:MAG: CoA-binding protein [Anaerolineae bacterium]